MKSSSHILKVKAVAIMLTGSMLATDMLTGCKSVKRNTNKTQRGAAIGAGAGAVAGGIIGRRSGSTAVGAILGATVGGAAGAVIGRRMDKQAEELEKSLENANVERVGEGIKVTFNSDLLFDVNKADLKPATRKNLDELAETLKKYEDTNVIIEGHADAQGSDEHNMKLSERRAEEVVKYLQSKGVAKNRLEEKGYGESQPVADNTTETGRTRNRRVEVAIFANEKLQKAAEKGDVK